MALFVIALPNLNRYITVAPTGGTGTYTYSYVMADRMDQIALTVNDNGTHKL
jgi:hypothetical protein